MKKNKPELITLDQALEISMGTFTNKNSLYNLICRGKLKRYGPPKNVLIDKREFLDYLNIPETA